MRNVLSQITEDRIYDDDDGGELGQGIKVSCSSCSVYVSGVDDEKG